MHRKRNAGDSRGDEFLNYTYMLKCSDERYTRAGTNDWDKRVEVSTIPERRKIYEGTAAVELAYYEEFETKEQAMKREYAIKQLGRKRETETHCRQKS